MRIWAEKIYSHLLAEFVMKALLSVLLGLIGDFRVFGGPRQGMVSLGLPETC